MDTSVVFSGDEKRSGPAEHMSVSVVAEDETAHMLPGETADKRSGPAEDETADKRSDPAEDETADKRSDPAEDETANKRSDPAEDETANKLSGETADKRSDPSDHMSVSVGEAEVKTAHKLSSPPEHPGVTRLRHRRLIAFVREQGFNDSYNELTNKTRAHMSLSHLRGLVQRGLWGDAIEYLDRYLPPRTGTRPGSFHANILRQFLVIHHSFANAVAGMGDKNLPLPTHYLQLKNDRSVSHSELRLRSIWISILAVDHVRANMNWQRVRDRALLVVSRLAHSAPELRGLIELPPTSIRPHHVLPITSGLRSRRRYVKKKQTGRTEAIIRALESQRLMVPGIGSLEEAKELLADLLDETVREGVQLITYGLSHPLQPGGNEGAQLCEPKLGTFTEAKTSGTLANGGTNQHVVEAGFHTNTVLQEERDLKRQRLIGAVGKASPLVLGPAAVVDFGAKLNGVSSAEETAGP